MPLNHKNTSRALALLSGISFCAIGAQPANALTLMEMLSGKRQPSIQEQVEGARPQSAQPPLTQKAIDMSDPEPLPKVSAPKYLTYKPDAMRPLKTAAFASASATDATRFLAQAKVAAPSDVATAVENYYAKNAAPIWVENGDVSERGRAVMALFAKAQEYGLDPADYALKAPSLTTSSVNEAPTATPVSTAPQTAAVSPAEQHDRDLMQFELALSSKVVLFAQDMVRGRIDANRISEYHDIKRKNVQLDPILAAVKAAPDAAAYLDGLAPQSPEFKALQAEMRRVRAEATPAAAAITLPETLSLKPGGSSPELSKLVAAIGQRGSDAVKAQHAALMVSYQNTPTYTPEVVELVKAFQKEAGLKPDGVVGRSTIRAITGHSDGDKVSKLMIAMEQARWLPNDLGQRYVFINQPAFRVYYHEHGQEQFSMRVVVGSPSHQTFFFQDEIETVEFNPYWGVPQSIIVNEMLPKLRQDPSYLDRMGYQVEVSGRAVSSTQVDWNASTQKVSVRQPPSSDNALGDLKILFPNAHAIYMHDTPQKSFFQRDMRALSHGCVRLAEPRKMAAAVLGITEKDVNDRIAQKKNLAVPVPQRFPIYVSYFTAWPNKDGKVEYFDDVYARDAAVMKAFSATTKARAI